MLFLNEQARELPRKGSAEKKSLLFLCARIRIKAFKSLYVALDSWKEGLDQQVKEATTTSAHKHMSAATGLAWLSFPCSHRDWGGEAFPRFHLTVHTCAVALLHTDRLVDPNSSFSFAAMR